MEALGRRPTLTEPETNQDSFHMSFYDKASSTLLFATLLHCAYDNWKQAILDVERITWDRAASRPRECL